jgi:glycosyltransferase involved in cell wall biosynthesis
MTVVHVFSGDLWAGAEVMISHLLPASQRAGLRVMALALNEGTLVDHLRRQGVETYVVHESRHSFAPLLMRAARLLRTKGDIVLHAHRYKENVLAWLLSRWGGARALITTLHGLPEPAPLGATSWRRTVGRLDQWLLRSRFTRVVAVSEELKRVLVGRFGVSADRLAVIWNGVPLPPRDATAGSRRQGPFHIGSVGRLVPVKGFELALETVALLRRDLGHVRLSILGGGPLRERLEARARELGILDCLDLRRPEIDPLPFYRSLDAYLNTSLHEGMPLSVLEAMACSRPVIAPRVGGIPEAVRDGQEGFLLDVRDPEAFAARCRTLLADASLREVMGDRARDRVRTCFSVERMAQAYAEIYECAYARMPG